MMLNFLNYGMGLASILFIIAVVLAKKKIQPHHKVAALAGTLITIVIGVGLIVFVQIVNSGELQASDMMIRPGIHVAYAIAHRILASITFLLMFYMAISGLRNQTRLHKKLGPIFLVMFLIVYLSGMAIFTRAL